MSWLTAALIWKEETDSARYTWLQHCIVKKCTEPQSGLSTNMLSACLKKLVQRIHAEGSLG